MKTFTKFELVAEIERRIGQPTSKLWRASGDTLRALLDVLPKVDACPTANRAACDDTHCPGWAVFNLGEAREGIQRCDTCERFPSDDAARAHVRKCEACKQSNYQQRRVHPEAGRL